MSTSLDAQQRYAVDGWQWWRSARDDELRHPYGWLSVTALHWLSDQPTRFADLPGTWSVSGAVTTVRATVDDGLRHGGEPIDGTVEVLLDQNGNSPLLEAGRRRLEVLRRGGRFAVRVRDPDAPTRAAFHSVPGYPPTVSWVIPARFHAYPQARQVVVGSVVDGLTHQMTAAGRIELVIGDQERWLTAFRSGATLLVLFRDATSGVTTHPGVRAVTVALPNADGQTLVDFNRAMNLPCAFIDHATCPLPPPENHLPVPVEAGERDPRR